jgi:hypothetical protein
MSVTISADDPRTIRAIEIAACADTWLDLHADGHDAYGVPSQSDSGRYYLVTPSSCDCAYFRRNDLSAAAGDDAVELRACKHILAVRLFQELVRAQQNLAPATSGRRQRHLRLLPHTGASQLRTPDTPPVAPR